MSLCVRCVVSGRVQGVFYRATTQEMARSLGVTGYARNQRDGTVEVLACGNKDKVQKLQEWLWQGPPAAKVTQVDCQTVAGPAGSGFTTG